MQRSSTPKARVKPKVFTDESSSSGSPVGELNSSPQSTTAVVSSPVRKSPEPPKSVYTGPVALNASELPKQQMRCPYVPLHIVPRHAMIRHMTVCREANKLHWDWVFCQYDKEHLEHRNDLEEHEEKCPSNPMNKAMGLYQD